MFSKSLNLNYHESTKEKNSRKLHQRHSQKYTKNLFIRTENPDCHEALRAEMSVAELCRKYSINESQFYKWNKEFLEAGKKRLAGDTTREATSDEVAELKKENQQLKVMIADLVLRYDIVKKSLDMLD